MTLAEYHEAVAARMEAVSANRSRRLRGLPLVPVPPKPKHPQVPVAYEADGTYYGDIRELDEDEYDPTWIVKMEDQTW